MYWTLSGRLSSGPLGKRVESKQTVETRELRGKVMPERGGPVSLFFFFYNYFLIYPIFIFVIFIFLTTYLIGKIKCQQRGSTFMNPGSGVRASSTGTEN